VRVGFIGLGRMGRPMSESLAHAGHDLVLCDAQAEVAASLAQSYGGKTAATPAELVRACEAVVLSLPGPAESESVMAGPAGILASAAPGFLVVDMTTNTLTHSRDMARRAAERGIPYLDAPVSRGNGTGQLTVMVGGDERAFARARPLLEAIAATVCWVGASGAGTAAKLVNQAVYVTYMAAFAEGLSLAESFGIPLEAALTVLGRASAGDPLITTKYPEIRGQSDQRFPVANALRYLDAVEEAFGIADSAKPVIEAAAASLRNAVTKGAGGDDIIVARRRYLARSKS
jgi:3-hydroxyisobutyrate dehydrogenase-like beta-hydroxyacid dehydrogenase